MDIKFTAKDILEKDFKTGMRGYNQENRQHLLQEQRILTFCVDCRT